MSSVPRQALGPPVKSTEHLLAKALDLGLGSPLPARPPRMSPPSLSELYEEHYEYVWRTLLRLGVRDAEDAAQNVFLIVRRKLPTYDTARPPRPWLFGIAYNVARDLRRKASARREKLMGAVAERASSRSPDADRLEAAQLVHAALDEVEESRRAIFVLYELDREPMKEVSATLGIPLNTAYSSLRRARGEFRAAVVRLGGL